MVQFQGVTGVVDGGDKIIIGFLQFSASRLF